MVSDIEWKPKMVVTYLKDEEIEEEKYYQNKALCSQNLIA